ncbi:MAG: hypothetical protein KDC44_21360, partial [Phaeodactylibacter sp.]|nr:hypothetical protein [Phaeodactylibacter sp.]
MRRIWTFFYGLFWLRRRWTWPLFGLLLLAYLFCLPRQLFQTPYSVVLEDATGRLLGARIARDGQWRFPELEAVPEKFETALLQFE